jgi:hypothetical protein
VIASSLLVDVSDEIRLLNSDKDKDNEKEKDYADVVLEEKTSSGLRLRKP